MEATSMARLTAIFSVVLGLLLGGCAYRYEPIYNVDRAMPPGAEHLPQDQIRDIIVTAGKQLEWNMTPIAPDHLEASQSAPKYSAIVDIYYTPTRLKIVIKSTTGFLQTSTTIHDHYNFWIRNLESRIITDVSVAAKAGSSG
jgi:hypothetical protein